MIWTCIFCRRGRRGRPRKTNTLDTKAARKGVGLVETDQQGVTSVMIGHPGVTRTAKVQRVCAVLKARQARGAKAEDRANDLNAGRSAGNRPLRPFS